jgi:hypothetical protein
MAIADLLQAPQFYVVGSAVVALCFSGLGLLFWSAHKVLDLLRDWREFRRGN